MNRANSQGLYIPDVSKHFASLQRGSVPPCTLGLSSIFFITQSFVAKPFGAVCTLASLKFAKYYESNYRAGSARGRV